MSLIARFLFAIVYILVGLGIVMSYSASSIYAAHVYGNAQYFLLRQVLFSLIGSVFLFLFWVIPVKFWQKHSRQVIVTTLVLLAMVWLPVVGRSAGGAQRWLHLGLFNFQPAEFAKIGVCLYLSDYLARKIKFIKEGSRSVFIPPMLLVGTLCCLLLLQPDLGSCVFIFMIAAVLFFMAGIPIRFVATAALLFVPVFYFLVVRVPYRLSRVTAFLDPWQDPQGSGFQIIQSFLAFGLGGVKGVGLGASTQKLFYLPSSYNDFIFSIIGEELGLIGMLAVLLLYGGIFICGILIAERARHNFERLLTISLTFMIILQALINMLVATGLIPTKGLPLPFVSYGGTSLVFNLMAVGLLLSLDRQSFSRS